MHTNDRHTPVQKAVELNIKAIRKMKERVARLPHERIIECHLKPGRLIWTSRATVKTMRAEIEQAVQLLRGQDPKAMDQALALLQDTVFSFSMKVCGQREDAEDTMQEVLMKSMRFLPQFESSKALAVWLYKVAR